MVDEFSLFYLYWVAPEKQKRLTKDYWLTQSQSPIYHAWAGYAFESICITHSESIIRALNIKSSHSISTWSYQPKNKKEDGAQIDLLIDRIDDAITLCEIKYTTAPFLINKEEAKKILKKIAIFKAKTKTKKQIFWAFISASGIKNSVYAEELVQQVVTLDALFQNLS